MFVRAFGGGGTICGTCACGVTHFASFDPGCFEEGELDDLRQKREQMPTKYKEHDCSSLTIVHIDGKQFVDGCECGKLKFYEDWVWAYRDQIAQYLMVRLTHQQTTIQRTMGYLNDFRAIKKPGCLVPEP